MKIKISVITSLIIALFISACNASVSFTNSPDTATNDTTQHAMLHPDANTIYLDSAGNKMDNKKFMQSMQTGKYTFVPQMKDGKVISIKLKAVKQKISMGAIAPEFSATDINGHVVDLKTLKGKLVVLNFWFTSCAPCLNEISELNGLVDKYKGDSSIVFIAVTYNNVNDVKAFLKRKEFKYDILPGGINIINQYGITGYPTSMVIDGSGHIAFLLATYDGSNAAQLDGVIGALKKMQ